MFQTCQTCDTEVQETEFFVHAKECKSKIEGQ